MSTKGFLNGLDMASQKIVSLADPSAATDAVNLQTLQLYVNGLDNKASVRAATTAAGVLLTDYENGDTLDGVVLATGNRILIKNQALGATNGIYVVQASGAPVRATDADISAEVTAGLVTFVSEGTTNGNTNWQLTTDDPITLGTTALTFTQIGVGSIYTAGGGLTESPALTFNVGAGLGITVNTDDVALASSTAGAGLTYTSGVLDVVGDASITVGANSLGLATGVSGAGLTLTSGVLDVVGDASITVGANSLGLATGVAGTGLTLTTGVLNVVGGTGITANANDIAVDTSVVVRKFASSIGNGSLTSIAVTHNLGTKDIVWSMRDTSTDAFIGTDGVATDTNTLTLTFAVAPTTNQYRVAVQG